ncbi:MAG: DUF58 domain-containing protein [Planctomycetota bacterium]
MAKSRVNRFVSSLQERQIQDAADGLKQTRFADPASARPEPAPSVPTFASPAEPRPIFDPQMLSKLGQLEVIASTVVDGFLSGKHRSTHKGGCTDFAEFRPYSQGDDIRQLDWRHYAKCDRYYVKQFDDETNLQALLVTDASGSMQFGMSTVTKWHYAQMTAACLGHLLLRQRDSVGLAVVGDSLKNFVRPLPRASQLARVINVLETTIAEGESTLSESMLELTGRLKRRGMIMLFSDCFGEVAPLMHVLQQYRARGHDVMVFQILAPEELTFPFRRESFFQDLELPRRMQVNPSAIRKQYLAEFQAFQDNLRESMTAAAIDLVTLTTDQDIGEALSGYLLRRAAQKSASSARVRA